MAQESRILARLQRNENKRLATALYNKGQDKHHDTIAKISPCLFFPEFGGDLCTLSLQERRTSSRSCS